MPQQPARRFDLILADPPYHTTNLAFDRQPPIDWAAWWPQAWRLLEPGGSIVLFADSLFTVDLIAGQRRNYSYRWVWEKSMATGHLAAARRPLRMHEDILVFCKQPGKSIFNPQKSPRPAGVGDKSNSSRKGIAGHYNRFRDVAYQDDGERFPTSVLHFPSVPTTGRLHPTQKPVELMRYLVRTYSNPGQRVLDCQLEDRFVTGVERQALDVARAARRLEQVRAAPPAGLHAAVATGTRAPSMAPADVAGGQWGRAADNGQKKSSQLEKTAFLVRSLQVFRHKCGNGAGLKTARSWPLSGRPQRFTPTWRKWCSKS